MTEQRRETEVAKVKSPTGTEVLVGMCYLLILCLCMAKLSTSFFLCCIMSPIPVSNSFVFIESCVYSLYQARAAATYMYMYNIAYTSSANSEITYLKLKHYRCPAALYYVNTREWHVPDIDCTLSNV